jgi:hypothetical protein
VDGEPDQEADPLVLLEHVDLRRRLPVPDDAELHDLEELLPGVKGEQRRHACQVARARRDLTAMLATAFDRIDDFVAVQRAAGGPTVAAVELLQEAAGVDARDRALVAARAAALGVSAEALLLGILVARLAQ